MAIENGQDSTSDTCMSVSWRITGLPCPSSHALDKLTKAADSVLPSAALPSTNGARTCKSGSATIFLSSPYPHRSQSDGNMPHCRVQAPVRHHRARAFHPGNNFPNLHKTTCMLPIRMDRMAPSVGCFAYLIRAPA